MVFEHRQHRGSKAASQSDSPCLRLDVQPLLSRILLARSTTPRLAPSLGVDSIGEHPLQRGQGRHTEIYLGGQW